MRRVWASILAVALCLSFAACGKEKEVPNPGSSLTDSLRSKQTSGEFASAATEKPIDKPSELGLYYGTTYAYNDQVYNMIDIYSSGVSLELQSGGKAVLLMDGQPLEGTWKLDGETFVMTYQFTDSPGTLQGDTITMDFMGMGMKMTFVKDGGTGPVVPVAPADDPEEPAFTTPIEVENAGILDYETIAEVYDWLLDYASVENNYGKAPYDEIVRRMGGMEGAPANEDIWNENTRFYRWGISEEEFIKLTFKPENGEWVHCGSTNTTAFADIYDKHYNRVDEPAEVPAEVPVEAPVTGSASSFGDAQSYIIDEFFSDIEVTVCLALPESMWVADAETRTLYAYNEPSSDVTHSASPRIQFELKGDLEKVNTYVEKAGNLKEMPGRTIGGVQMQGRSYDLWGMDWIEYYGELPNGLWMTVKASGVSLDAGSEGSEILDRVVFE